MARLLDDWITSYMHFARNTEPPRSYHLWTAVSIIASVLQRKVLFQWGHHEIYPNQYIVLVGPSGTARKGEAMGIAKQFLDHIGVTVAPPKITREALIRLMSESITNFIDSKKNFVFQSPITVFSKELSVFLGQKNTGLLADLTDIYDSDKSWAYLTKHGEKTKDPITGPCLNLLGATAPDWIPTILPSEAVGGGWTSRVIFIVEEDKGQVVKNPNKYPPDQKLLAKLKKDLEQINLLVGEYSFTSEALDAYEDWYGDQEDKLKKGTFPIQDPRFGGYVARRATHIKKVGMVLSASRGDSFLVEIGDFNRAKKMLEDCEKKMLRIFSGIGKSDIAEAMNSVLNVIMARGQITRSELMRVLYGDVDAWMLEQIENALVKMKLIEVVILTEENDALYKYTKPRQAEPVAQSA